MEADQSATKVGLSDLDRELLVLNAIVGIDRVSAYPKHRFDSSNLNNNGVKCRIVIDDAKPTVNVHCGADYPDKLAAAKELINRLKNRLGDQAVVAAERIVEDRLAAADSAGGSSSASCASAGMSVFEFQMERQKLCRRDAPPR